MRLRQPVGALKKGRKCEPGNRQAKARANFVEAVRTLLAGKGCPRDEDFRDRLESARLYGGGDRREKTKLILERIESSHEHKESVVTDGLTIEHVMPQSLTEAWKSELGQTWEDDHEQLLHTLGNLTLTSYNGELANDSFAEKKRLYATSHLELNRYFAEVEHWSSKEIEQRAASLASRALRVWPFFGPTETVAVGDAPHPVTGSVPSVVTIRGEATTVRSWVDVAVVTVTAIAQLGDEEFDRVAAELPKFVSRSSGASRRSSRLKALPNGAFLETNLSAKALYTFSFQAAQLAGLGTDEWSVAYGPAANGDDDDDAEDRPGVDASTAETARLEFWTATKAALAMTGKFPSLQTPRGQYWFDISLGRSFVWLSLTANTRDARIGVKLVMSSPAAERFLTALAPHRAAIEAEIGFPLEWNPHPQKKEKSIKLLRDGNALDPATREESIAWLTQTAIAFKTAFWPRLAEVEL